MNTEQNAHKLIPDNMVIPKIREQEGKPIEDHICYLHLFDPYGSWEWYVCELDKEYNIAFGYVNGFCGEWGDFSIDELKSIKIGGMQRIERDPYFIPKKFSEIQPQ